MLDIIAFVIIGISLGIALAILVQAILNFFFNSGNKANNSIIPYELQEGRL